MEEYIEFQTAKLAKEKGFNIPTSNLYEYALNTQIDPETNDSTGAFGWKEGECKLIDSYMINNHKNIDFSNTAWYMCSAPTQAELCKWLRDVHDIHVWVEKHPDDERYFPICPKLNLSNGIGTFLKHEEAMEAILFMALNLI